MGTSNAITETVVKLLSIATSLVEVFEDQAAKGLKVVKLNSNACEMSATCETAIAHPKCSVWVLSAWILVDISELVLANPPKLSAQGCDEV